MKTRPSTNKLLSYLSALALLAGCASTTVTNRQPVATGFLPRPGQIWVYPFAASPADVPPESSLAGESDPNTAPPTAEQLEEGRQLGSQIATGLVQQIIGMGMPAAIASAATRPQLNDLVIEGALLSVQEGSATERVVIGFSAGGSEVKVAVEVFQMTASGLRKLGSGDVGSTGNKTPGSAVGLATLVATGNLAGLIISTGLKVYGEKSGRSTVEGRAKQISQEIGDTLKKRFEQQGWIA